MNSKPVWGPQRWGDGGDSQGCPLAAGQVALTPLTLLPLQPGALQDLDRKMLVLP